jgi:hypothetical protein
VATTTTTIPGYGQDLPCEVSAVQSLAELLGADLAQRAWDSAAERAGVHPPVDTLDSLGDVARQLVLSDRPLVRVAGRSLLVRIGSYRALSMMLGRTA